MSSDYSGPTPPYGVHRYQFFIFEQPDSFVGSIYLDELGKFDMNDFAVKHNLCNSLKGTYQYYATEEFALTGGTFSSERCRYYCYN